MTGSRLFHRIVAATAASCLAGLPVLATDPPTSEMIRQYQADGSWESRLARATALGNHKVDPALSARAEYRLKAELMRQQGYSEAQVQTEMAPPPAWKGLPTKGSPKILVMLMDFADNPAQVPMATIEAKVFGAGNASEFPVESLRKYYQRASYNQLDLQGNVLGYYRYPTAKAQIAIPSDYAAQVTLRENIIKELIQNFKSQGHDFSQYDNDGDGVIDYFVVIWTGPNNGWANFWWAYKTNFQDQTFTVDGKKLSTYVWQYLDQGQSNNNGNPAVFYPRTMIHETGHALGLPDYYDYNDSVGPKGGVGGLDMMASNLGDHNAFSKWLLEWLTPTVVTSSRSGITLRPKGEFGDAVLVMPSAPTNGSPFGEYFLVENRLKTQNDNDPYWPGSGLMIWHVDATLNGTNYKFDNSYTGHKLLRLMEADGLEQIEQNLGGNAGDFWTPGKTLGPTTTPNTKMYGGQDSSVVITNILGGATSWSFDATVTPASLVITSFSPASGPHGTVVTLTGTGFTGATSVKISGYACTFTVTNDQQMTVTIPDYAQTAPIVVTTPAGTVQTGAAFTVASNEAPSITSFTPESGDGGTKVVLTGKGFSGLTNISVNGQSGVCGWAQNDTTAMFYLVPTNTSGPVTVTTPKGTAIAPKALTVLPSPLPTITSITPTSGKPGDLVTVAGQKLIRGDGTYAFNGVTAGASSSYLCNGTSMRIIVPSGATTGPLVFTSSKGNVTGPIFTVTGAAPVLTSFNPTSGYTGITPVVLTGTGFTGATAVAFNGTSAAFTVNSDTQITATVPAAATTGAITVTTPGGTVTSTATFTATTGYAPRNLNISTNGAFTDLGATKTFSARSTAMPAATFQWQSSTDGTTWVDITGAIASTYTTPAVTMGDHGKQFRFKASNGYGSAFSGSSIVRVATAVPTITVQPELTQTVPTFGSPYFQTTFTMATRLALEVSRDGGTTWASAPIGPAGARQSSSSIDTAVWSFATGELSAADNGSLFRVKLSNNVGDVYSTPVLVNVTSGQLLHNPGFEQGNTSWTEAGNGGAFATGQGRTGYWHLWHGGYGSATPVVDEAFQDVAIPAEAGTVKLTFYANIQNNGTAPSEAKNFFFVKVKGTDGIEKATLKTLSNLDATTGYQSFGPLDLSAYRGQTIRLSFGSVTTGQPFDTSFFVDDVALVAGQAKAVRSDFNGDGKSDLLWRNPTNGQIYIMPMNGSATLAGGMAHTEADPAWKLVGMKDVDGDGKADMVWWNSGTGQIYEAIMDGSTVKSWVAAYREPNTDWVPLGAADVDGDGKADLVWRNRSTGQVFVGLMDGASLKGGSIVHTEPSSDWRIVSLDDFNGDGKADLLWRNSKTGQVYLMILNGASVTSASLLHTESDLAWTLQGSGDFDGDATADLLWRNTSTGQVYVMPVANGAVKPGSIVHTEANPDWQIVALGDQDGDSKCDIVWHNAKTGQVFQQLMNGTQVKAGALVYTDASATWKVLDCSTLNRANW